MKHNFNIGNRWTSEYIALAERGITQGYTPPSYDFRGKINRLIRDLKDANAWNEMDILYLFAHDGDNNWKTMNLISPTTFKATPQGGIASNNFGFVGNLSSHYIDTTYNLSSSPTNYLVTDCCQFCWVSTAQNNILSGANFTSYNNLWNSNTVAHRSNSSDALLSAIDLTGTGFKMIGRNDNALLRAWNGVTASTGAQATTALPNATQHILRRLGPGATPEYGGARVGLYGMSGYLGALASQMNDAISTYMNSI